jgi:beta-glucosidase
MTTRTIRELLAQLSIAEKARLTAGDGPWTVPGIERAGVFPIKMTDGSNGARGDHFHGTTSVCFPSGSALGATWDPALAESVGRALAVESRRKQANVLLGPTINLHRYPLAGRNFESLGEDPVLVGTLAAAYIRGVQSGGVAAVPKHLVGNDSEIERESVDVLMDERTLREVYLVPFEMAVRDGGAWALMTAYSKLNGTYCSENAELLGIVKHEWEFDGAVISDWGGVDSTLGPAEAGLDIEMPGPANYLGDHLAHAVLDGNMDMRLLDDKAERVLRLADRTGALASAPGEEISVDDPADRALVRRVAREAIVLLKNEAVLPLTRKNLRKIAVIGPAARHTQVQGGGSSRVNPPYEVSILDGIRAAVDDAVRVDYSEGGSIARFTRPLDTTHLTDPDGRLGAVVEYYRRQGDQRHLIRREPVRSMELTWIGAPLPDVPMPETVIVCRATLRVPESGDYVFGLIGAGHVTASLDRTVILDTAEATTGGPHFFGRASEEVHRTIRLESDRDYDVEILLEPRVEKSATAGAILGMLPPTSEDPVSAAADVARSADVAVVAVGTSGEWEMEGGDRPSFGLPGEQEHLVKAVAQANPNTIVLINSGSAVALPFLDDVAGALYVWFGGQELGNAVADVLFGRADAGGRMPFSVPRTAEEMLDLHYRGEGGAGWGGSGGTITHFERGRIGYRHHEALGLPALVPFGHGMTYGDIDLGDIHLDRDESRMSVVVELENTGTRVGTAVPQVYVTRDPDEPRSLAAFQKVTLAPGERTTVEIPVPERTFQEWSVEEKAWTPCSRPCRIEVGASAEHILWSSDYSSVMRGA